MHRDLPACRLNSQSCAEFPASAARVGHLTFWTPGRLSSVLTSLKSLVRPDSFHVVLSERSVRWYNACLRITRDADLAADAVQEALLKAWDRRHEFRGEAALDTWIHRIALNAAIDLIRKRKRRSEEEIDPDAHESPPESAPEGAYIGEALTRDLAEAMQRLTTNERQAFLL